MNPPAPTAQAVRQFLFDLLHTPQNPYIETQYHAHQVRCATALLKAIETTDLENRLVELEADAQRSRP